MRKYARVSVTNLTSMWVQQGYELGDPHSWMSLGKSDKFGIFGAVQSQAGFPQDERDWSAPWMAFHLQGSIQSALLRPWSSQVSQNHGHLIPVFGATELDF